MSYFHNYTIHLAFFNIFAFTINNYDYDASENEYSFISTDGCRATTVRKPLENRR